MKRLTAKEEEVMGWFWEKGPLFVLSTVVRGLEEKGFVGHKAYGNTYQYYALVSRDDYRKGTLRGVISKYFDNSYRGVVSMLVQEEKISVEELKELIKQVEDGK